MQYLLDTVTIVRHFTKSDKMGKKAKSILNLIHGEHNFLVSVISLMEILYLSEKRRIKIDLSETISKINSSSNYGIEIYLQKYY